jgi:hypothetical protein
MVKTSASSEHNNVEVTAVTGIEALRERAKKKCISMFPWVSIAVLLVHPSVFPPIGMCNLCRVNVEAITSM